MPSPTSVPAPTKRSSARFAFPLFLTVLIGTAGAALLAQHHETVRLRAERDLGQLEAREAEQLRAEYTRLAARQPSATELQTLRADHAALPRLRAELEALSRPQPPGNHD